MQSFDDALVERDPLVVEAGLTDTQPLSIRFTTPELCRSSVMVRTKRAWLGQQIVLNWITSYAVRPLRTWKCALMKPVSSTVWLHSLNELRP